MCAHQIVNKICKTHRIISNTSHKTLVPGTVTISVLSSTSVCVNTPPSFCRGLATSKFWYASARLPAKPMSPNLQSDTMDHCAHCGQNSRSHDEPFWQCPVLNFIQSSALVRHMRQSRWELLECALHHRLLNLSLELVPAKTASLTFISCQDRA